MMRQTAATEWGSKCSRSMVDGTRDDRALISSTGLRGGSPSPMPTILGFIALHRSAISQTRTSMWKLETGGQRSQENRAGCLNHLCGICTDGSPEMILICIYDSVFLYCSLTSGLQGSNWHVIATRMGNTAGSNTGQQSRMRCRRENQHNGIESELTGCGKLMGYHHTRPDYS